ncbi:MAG: PEP-CTERM sorting domain-containing protein [Planctomycetota bacterium]
MQAGNLRMEVDVTSSDLSIDFHSGEFEAPLVFNSGSFFQFNPVGAPELSGQPFTIGGPINANNDISSNFLLSPNLNITNTSTQTLDFVIRMTWDVAHGTDVNWNSSSAWTLGGGPDPILFTLPGQSLWTLFIDSSPIDTLYDDPSGMGGGGDLVLNTDPISGSHGPVGSSMGIELAFSMTPGANAGVNGLFLITPAPGTLALLAVGAVVGRRRRRRA